MNSDLVRGASFNFCNARLDLWQTFQGISTKDSRVHRQQETSLKIEQAIYFFHFSII